MESDWEVEFGPDAPVIEALWPGFIDLRRTPERIEEIEEARRFPMLRQALLRVNGTDSSVGIAKAESNLWTAKCDVWVPEECDPDEMDATLAESACGLACYIDLLPREALVFAGLDEAEQPARSTVSRLRRAACRCCRADLVIRRAFAGNLEGMGITAYIAACGANEDAVRNAFSAAIATVAEKLEAGSA